MQIPHDELFEFGNFKLSPKERLLLRGDEAVAVTPKAFDLLVHLVRNSGHLVSKDDLLKEVWPGTTVEEVNLTVNISALRKALARGAGADPLIQTVPRHGYRFVAPVTSHAAAMTHQLTRPKTENPDAYRAYLQGRHHWNLRSEAGLKLAVERFGRAIDLDPAFAAAHSGLADSYATLGSLSHLAPMYAFELARRHALLALELDPSLAESHASFGFVKLYFERDWVGAETEFKHAVALDPDYPATRQWHGIYLLAAGRPHEALRELELARKRDPLSVSINTDLGFLHYYTGQYGEAAKQLQFVLEMRADFAPAHLWLGRTHQELGQYDAAIAQFRRVEAAQPEWAVPIAARGFVEGIAGRTEDARQTLAELDQLNNHKFVTSYGVALIHTALGEIDAAFSWLDRAMDERSNWLVWLRLDPRWKNLRMDPRFTGLIQRLGFPKMP
jgi:DNA-binding winged helix-turn-helix (wHTH) protein